MHATAQITLVAVAATSIFGFALGHSGTRSITQVSAVDNASIDSGTGGRATGSGALGQRSASKSVSNRPQPDLSGETREGVASYYNLAGRTMANGAPMDPRGNNAASRTLPLGTVARVTNIETGKSALITIQDRGPYVKGRIVDLSPATATKIGITARQGLGRVVVAPVSVPLPDGSVKPGTAAGTFAAAGETG